jgi:alpha-tubulin suppressor-like RCC1 family protein
VARRSLTAGVALCAAALAAVAAGCTSPGPRHPAETGQPGSTLVERWGSFFGGRPGNFGTALSPVTLRLPGLVRQVGTSNSTEYALLASGRVYAWGLGTQGQLGNGGDQNSLSRPVRVRFPAGVKIARLPTDVMPYDTGLAVDTRGQVWGWGHNGRGVLCLGNRREYDTPVKLPFSHVTALAGASNHATYDAAGTLYACGQDMDGDLGDGSKHSSTTPVKVAKLDGAHVTKLVASFANSGALLSNGTYYDWGYDGNGQLGDGHLHRNAGVPVRVRLPHPVTQVALGGSWWHNGQTLVLLADGSLRAWGDDSAFQLGNGKRGMRPSPIRVHPPAGVTYQSLATGSATSYALSASGRVYAWGVSRVGQVGDGRQGAARAPVLVATGAAAISATANNVVISVPRRTSPGSA